MVARLVKEYAELDRVRREELRDGNLVCAAAIADEMELVIGESLAISSGLIEVFDLT